MRGRVPEAPQPSPPSASPAPTAWTFDQEFVRFREIAAAFTASLAGSADFSATSGRSGAVQLNVEAARSVFGKWSLDILERLLAGHQLGFSDLKGELNGISSRILSSKLKELERLGFIRRQVLPTRPPRVNYDLTDRGLAVTQLGEPLAMYLQMVGKNVVARAAPGATTVRHAP
jgi:DNA-binding HxlR family transcriptional regulator